ncbi:hypothetical protein CXB51_029671 [Gossypium anomalum]|uniref:Aminotransferase-like plant mobile domain-containing protein n=1 Tax=Gossypium anomalum TaxID=47600 RepID=A0A8J5Y7X1_9ROSI|nr:hypothetical protein CXB51_029671 [Gossypium anomalum]
MRCPRVVESHEGSGVRGQVRGGDLGRTHFIFHAESVPLLWRMCSYNWDCRWMGPHSPGPFNLLIGEPGQIEIGWLRDTVLEPGNDSTKVERIRYAQAYILEMIGGYLMLDLSRNLVHLRWLLKFIDFRAVGKFNWGFAALATLYREMCRATPPNKVKIEGCIHYYNHGLGFAFHFYVLEWNHSTSYVGIPTTLEDIRLLLDQRSEAQFQWTPYKDPTIQVVILDELFQNPNIWHVKFSLVNYATVEMHQTNRVLWQFEFRQPILEELEVLDNEHKIDLRIHGKPYLLLKKKRRWQICLKKERQDLLNPKRKDDGTGPSIVPTQSPSAMPQLTIPTPQPLQIMSRAYPSPYMYPNPYMFPFPSSMSGWNAWPGASHFPMTLIQPPISRPSSLEGSHEAPSGSSSYYQSPLAYGIQTPPYWVMQTPRIFYSIKVGHPLNTYNRSNHNPCWSNHNPRRELNQ